MNFWKRVFEFTSGQDEQWEIGISKSSQEILLWIQPNDLGKGAVWQGNQSNGQTGGSFKEIHNIIIIIIMCLYSST